MFFFNRVSGHEDGLVLLPESNKVTVFFTSDSERPDTGFNMTFEAVEITKGDNFVKSYISQKIFLKNKKRVYDETDETDI